MLIKGYWACESISPIYNNNANNEFMIKLVIVLILIFIELYTRMVCIHHIATNLTYPQFRHFILYMPLQFINNQLGDERYATSMFHFLVECLSS